MVNLIIGYLLRLNALEDLNPVTVSIISVFIVDTIPHIISTNLKVNFPVVSVIRASLFYIIISGVLSETLKTFKFIYWTS